MTRKDYELIARGVCLAMVNGIITDKQMFGVADTLADQLQQENPKFDSGKFLQACGIEQ